MGILLLVRHADAGDKRCWDEPDLLRPLSTAGRAQAVGLVERLQDYPVEQILSSPAVRCQQTVQPLARDRYLQIEPSPALGVDGNAAELLALGREALRDGPVRPWRDDPLAPRPAGRRRTGHRRATGGGQGLELAAGTHEPAGSRAVPAAADTGVAGSRDGGRTLTRPWPGRRSSLIAKPAGGMMRRSIRAGLLLLAVALAASGCGRLGPGRNPSGTTTTTHMDAAGVTRLDVAYGFDVRVRLGQPEAVTVTYDDNLADLLDVRVDGRTLRIQLKPHSNFDNRPTLRAEVTMSRLEEIRAAGASSVTVDGQLPDSGLRLLVSGSSRVAADLALDQADATVSGSSRLELTGTADALSAQGSGASRLELADLRLQTLEITLSGASRGNVFVDRTIAAQVSGASELTYKRTPQFTKRDTSGASTIQPS